MSQQSKIDIETQAGVLLKALAEVGFSGCYPEEVYRWLESREYIYFIGLNPKITTKGEEYYFELCSGSAIRSNPRIFKEEARSGLREVPSKKGPWKVSEKSPIQRAAVPTCGAPKETKTPEDMLAEEQGKVDARKRFMDSWDLTSEQLHEYVKEKRIRMCNTCGEPGVFDRNGKYFQSACRKCRKQKRK